MKHRASSTKPLTRVAFATVCLLALTAFVVASTVTDKKDSVDVAPQAAPQGPRLSAGDFIASDPVVPVLTRALRDMPPFEYPMPGDPIKEIPRRNNRIDGWEAPIPAQEIWTEDPLLELQRNAPQSKVFTTPDINVPGAGYTFVNPPDTVGDVGPNHYVQMINGGGTVVTIYDKTGGVLLSTSMTGIGGCSTGGGDPIVLYDDDADRWLLSEFGSGNSLCVQISQTADPTGAYFSYNFPTPSFPDYPKYGVWPSATNSAYFVGSNEAARAAYALDRAQMLAGGAATSQRFTMPNLAGFGFQMALPAHADGPTPPPVGRNNVFMRHRDDEVHNAGSNNPTQDFLEMWEFNIDWATPGNSSLTQLPDIPVSEFSSELCGLTSFSCVPMPGTGVLLDPLREVIMFALQYRNNGSHESITGNFVVDAGDFTDHHAMRWFELRSTGGGPWSLFQEGTYSPDSDHRWMGSIAQDQEGNIAMGYSVSSTTTSPSMRYTGRLVGDALGTMTQAETTIIAGSGNNASNRWGDYSSMSVDPSDDCTFWHTNMYTDGTGVWNTQVAAFKFDACGEPGISFSGTPLFQQVCAPAGNGSANIDLTIGSIQGYTDPADLAFGALPAGFAGVFTVDPVTPPGTSQAQMTLTAAADGLFSFDITATPGPTPADPRQITASIEVFSIAPGSPTLLTPTDTATNVPTVPSIPFSWTNVGATNYFIEVATDAAFTSVIASANTTATSINGTGFPPATTLYWRVTASNPCGPATSAVFSFTTSSAVPLTLGDDDFQEVTLPFGFNFCGTTYNSVFVGSNGYVTFGGGDTDFSESVAELIAGAPNPARIAVFWDDLAPNNGGTVLTDVSGGNFVITYDQVPEFSNTGANTGVLTLRPDGTFQIAYGPVSMSDGLAGHAAPGQNDGGETDLSAAPQPITGTIGDALYEIFTGADNDLSGQTLEFAACPIANISPAQPDVCYGSGGFIEGGNLMTLDTTTGVASIIGPTGLGGVAGLAIDSAGTIYGSNQLGDIAVIDAATGFGVVLGNPAGVGALRALAFDAGDTLYASDGSALFTIDTSTVVATLVGSHVTTVDMRGLHFDPATGILYGSTKFDNILIVSTADGSVSALPSNVGIAPTVQWPDLCFVDDVLYGVNSGSGGGLDTLVSIDKTTGAGIALIGGPGATGRNGISGLAAKLPVCGDGQFDPEVGEECDDGNLIDGDGCQSTCLLPVCGDGVVDPGEECEPPSVGNCDAGCLFNVNVITPGDDGFVEVPLPFAFPFCGVDYNSVWVNGNGNLTFGGGDTDFSESVGELLSQEPRIAPFWDDLRPPSGGTVFWSQVGPDILITYEDIPEYFSTGANTATVTLRPDGTHQIAYGALTMLDGLAGRSPGGNIQPDPGETDLSAAAQPLGVTSQVVYEQFTNDNDLAGLTLEFAACPLPGQLFLPDDGFEEVPLPFTFDFCGFDYNSVFVGSNGYVTFGGGDTDFSESVGELLSQEPRIAMLWDDLRPPSGGTIQALPNGADFDVIFTDIPEYFATGANSFTLKLRPDGTYQVAYGTLSASDGLAGRSQGGGLPDPGEIDLSGATPPIGTGEQTVYENFNGGDNDLSGLTLEYDRCPLDRPVIDVAPPAISSTQPTNSTTGHPVTVFSVGTQDLVWNMDEAYAAPVPAVRVGNLTLTAKPATTTQLPGNKVDASVEGKRHRLGPTEPNSQALQDKMALDSIQGSRANILGDPGFEAGTPNPVWTEASTNFGTPLCTVASCGTGTGTGPANGLWWAWFGGIAANEAGSVSQSVVIPTDVDELRFNYESIVCDSPDDYWQLVIDGTVIFTSFPGDGADFFNQFCGQLGYTAITFTGFGTTGFADGGVHTVEIRSEIFATNGGGSNFFFDDVVLDSPSFIIPGCDNPNDVPWLSVAPVTGATTAPGANQPLLATLNSTGLSNGLYEAILCFNSNDVVDPLVEVPVTLIVADTPPAGNLFCNGTAEGFDAGVPADWSVTDDDGNGLVWTDNTTTFDSNYTGGAGLAAMANSDAFGSLTYDTSLISPPFDLTGFSNAELTYKANYQNVAGQDFLDVDITTDGGGSWTNLLSWNEDHGGFFSTPGENVSIDLSAYSGQTGLQLRYRYHENINGFDWYAQIDDVRITCDGPLPTPKMEANTLAAVDGNWQTVPLVNSYVDPVVVATVQYNNNTRPVVTRVKEVTSTDFKLKLQNPGDGNVPVADAVHYLVVESGVWLFDGVKVEARKYLSTTTSRKGAWGLGDEQTYGQNYVSPVVFAQVMTENDPRWSYAFAQGANHFSPPTATVLQTGKHVGEDTVHERANEMLGYIVFDAVHTTIGGVETEAALGYDYIFGVGNAPPYEYIFNNPFVTAPECVVTTSAGMDGGDGGWAQVHGPLVATTTKLYLSVDEDQIGDTERSHTSEQVNFIAFAGPMVFPVPPTCVTDNDCDDGIFCNGAETCDSGSCLLGVDPCPSSACDETADVCVAGAGPQLESVTATAGGLAPATVSLINSYVSPIVACTVVYTNGVHSRPVVPRIDSVTSNSFDVWLQNPGEQWPVPLHDVKCLVAEEGSWMIDGHPVEAAKYESTITDKERNWLGTFRTLSHGFTNPVVLGQVMSSNDPLWSYYWQQGPTSHTNPPSGSSLRNGKTVGEDSNVVRLTETIGYIVFEQSNGTLGGVTFEAALGPDTVQGIGNSPPYNYTFNVPFASPPTDVIATQAGMDGGDGSWAYLYESSAFSTATQLSLSVDEDQIFNAERGHTHEQVGYVAFQTPVVYPQMGCTLDAECDDGNFCNGVETCNVGTSTCQTGSTVVCNDGVGCTDDACNEATDSCDFTPNNANCDNGLFCDGAETCDPISDCQVGTDPCGGGTCDEGNDTCPGVGPTAQAEWGTTTAGGLAPATVSLVNTYVDPVVVTSIEYSNNTIPVVTRITNVTGTSFDVYLQNPSGGAVSPETVSYFVVEKGTWNIGGVKIEAQKYLSTKTAHDGDWSQFDIQIYGQSYTSPAVLGQVMSDNDAGFSAFWSRGSSRSSAPNATDIRTGKMVGEDPDTTRSDETIGFIVVQSGHGFLGGTEYECKVGTDSVRGVVNTPPYPYTFSTSFALPPEVNVAVETAMDGFNGGWMYTFGLPTATTLNLAGDEDQLADAERSRATEQAAYCSFQAAGSYP